MLVTLHHQQQVVGGLGASWGILTIGTKINPTTASYIRAILSKLLPWSERVNTDVRLEYEREVIVGCFHYHFENPLGWGGIALPGFMWL